jgi:hypothetical protein
MRVLILDRGAKFPLTPEQLGPMVEQFAGWREKYRAKMESFEFFVDGGGFGVVNVADEKELNQMLMELPFTFTDDIKVHTIIDGDFALQQLRDAFAAAPSG